jgi:hypothetical protein
VEARATLEQAEELRQVLEGLGERWGEEEAYYLLTLAVIWSDHPSNILLSGQQRSSSLT